MIGAGSSGLSVRSQYAMSTCATGSNQRVTGRPTTSAKPGESVNASLAPKEPPSMNHLTPQV